MKVASVVAPLVESIVGSDLPVRVRCWDGSGFGPAPAVTVLRLNSPDALRRLLYAPGELGLARAFVAGDLDVEGDIFDLLALRDLMAERRDDLKLRLTLRQRLDLLGAARRLGALGRPLPPPPEEARLSGARHSKRRDALAVSHHYDVSNDFYRIVLGPTMAYSCAYFERADSGLDQAQEAKFDLVCRKLGLQPGMRLLDVGCGWGGMAIHAAREHRVTVVGITLSEPQAELASKRVVEAGYADRIEIRLQDYRDVEDGPFDGISSIGMFEHVGLSQLQDYFERLLALLPAGGRLLNHAISRSRPDRSSFEPDSFIARYVFPDGELHEVGTVITTMQRLGFEVRDVESLREHYARTLRHWVTNLQSRWDEAQRLAQAARARIWRLYMAGSALAFEAGRISVHQVLGVKPSREGGSQMPPTRTAFIAS
jgi:cyclopropane-fatty-acyl-phospholipid synthase